MVFKDVYFACSICDSDILYFDKVDVIWEGLNFRIEGIDCDLCSQNQWYIDSFGDDEEE